MRCYYNGSNGILIVYDISDRTSFENVKKWIIDIEKISTKFIPKILVGNKRDLLYRATSYEEARNLADELNIEYFETSAKDNINIDSVFKQMIDYIRKTNNFLSIYQKAEENEKVNHNGNCFACNNIKNCIII